jgi:hypothetical protein
MEAVFQQSESFFKNQMLIDNWIYVWVLYFIGLCLGFTTTFCLYNYDSVV